MGWKVILPDRYLKPVENKIHEIAGSVGNCVPDETGMMGGKAGLACFYAYYADWSGNRVFDSLAVELIEQALNPAAGHFPAWSFSNGVSGIAWMIHHLSSDGLSRWDASSIFDDLDPSLYKQMMLEIRSGHYDYLHGALGIALYFLRQAGNKKYRCYLEELVDELDQVSEQEVDGSVKWLSLLNPETKDTGYNLSLSHGIASIIMVLSKIYAAGIAQEKTELLIRNSIKYLEKQKINNSGYSSVFPSWATQNHYAVEQSRLAWCYGDLGIGMALLEAGHLFPASTYKSDGMQVLLQSVLRRDPAENSVLDAGICHGASGIALIYNVLHQKTGMRTFRDVALYWLDVCLNMAYHKDGIAGYKAWYGSENGGWMAIPGLLDGSSGIGLALLSFISEREPSWLRALLLT